MIALHEAVYRLPLADCRRLGVVGGKLIRELDGPRRFGVLLARCDECLAVLKRLPVPAEFALVRREVLHLKNTAMAARRC